MDMSKTIRQPVVVAGRISVCVDRLGYLKAQLAETEDELRQLQSTVSFGASRATQ